VVAAIIVGCTTTAGAGGTASFYATRPPQDYRGAGTYIVQTFDDLEQVRAVCSVALGYQGNFMACAVTRGGACYIYAPNPSTVSVHFEPLFIHEAGHCNGWSGNHPWS
jgi:hypothetical protein